MKTVAQLLRLDGRVGVITGGAGHIGLALGEALAELGARLAIVDCESTAHARAQDLSLRFGCEAEAVVIDLLDPGSAETIVSSVKRRFGRIDVLINNAALTGARSLRGYAVPFNEQTLEAWDAAGRVNLTSAFQLCRAAGPELAASGAGSVINIASIYGLVGPNVSVYKDTEMATPAAYAATKAGLIQLTRYLATVFAPGIRVNAVSPGGIERGQPETFQERYKALTPLRRLGREEDLKGAVALLASDAGAYITGQNIVVDGGWTAW